MRGVLFATAALIAAPAAAQDHSAHGGHSEAAVEQDDAAQAGQEDESAHHGHSSLPQSAEAEDGPGQGASAASATGHGDPHSMNDGAMDHGSMHRGAMEHADHGAMDRAEHEHMDHPPMDHRARGHGAHADAPSASGPPPRAFEGPRHAADTIFGTAAMARSRAGNAVMDRMSFGTLMLDRLEARVGEGADGYLWEAQGWYGGDEDKLWLKSEGEGAFGGGLESAEVQALLSHAIGPFFDLQAGLRYDFEPDGRAHAVLGVQGLAPYLFEVDAAAFLSDEGDLTGRIEAEYDQRITQRLILQPRAELSLAAQDIPERGIGVGLSSVEAGLRLRYEFAREFAPYVGVGYEARLGDTADHARAVGEDPDSLSLLLGLRAWF